MVVKKKALQTSIDKNALVISDACNELSKMAFSNSLKTK